VSPIVVIGAGLAGWTAVREFRKLDTATPVVMITADAGDFYAKPSLSNAFAQKRTPAQLVTTQAAKMAETLGVTLLAHTLVLTLDTASQSIQTQSTGAAPTSLTYSQLVLATGARPIRAPLAGDAAGAVQVVNSLDDFGSFYQRLAPPEPKTLLLIGAGLIGCEFANDLLLAGYKVHIVDPSPQPLAALLPAAAGLELQQALQELGAVWHLGCTVQSLDHRADDGDAQALLATLSDESTLPVDAVLSAIGLRADTTLAQQAQLKCERGVVVDMRLQTSAAHVYALGDCAQYDAADRRTLPYVMPIMQAAKALAATLAGNPTLVAFPLMPVSIKTPACPIVIASASPLVVGQWTADGDGDGAGVWRFIDSAGVQRGFVLTGKQTSRRMELSKSTTL
jgi:rubredoxin-NAD+ reductase